MALGGVTSGNTVGVAFSTLSGNGVPFEGWQRLSQGGIKGAGVDDAKEGQGRTDAAVHRGLGIMAVDDEVDDGGEDHGDVIPLVAMLPILMYIGMIIGTQAFSTAKPRHW